MGEAGASVARAVAIAAFLAVVACLGWFDVVNLDFGWHLKTGEVIAATGSIPKVDVFSYVAEGNPWLDSHWLFQLLLHGSHSLAGIRGVVLLRVGVAVLTFSLLLATRYRREYFALSLIVGLLALFVAFQRFLLRPELLTLCFLAATFYLIENLPRHRRLSLLALPAVQVAWNNVHGLHVLGPVFLLLHLLGDLLQDRLVRALPRFPAPPDLVREWRPRIAVTAACWAALLVNANGLAGIVYPYEIFGELVALPTVFSHLGELQSPFGLVGVPFPHPAVCYKLLLLLSLLALLGQLGRLRLAHLLPYAAFLFLSTLALRNMSLFAIVATPVTIRNLYGVADFVARRRARPLAVAPALVMLQSLAFVGLSAWIGARVADDSLYDRLGYRRRFGAQVSDTFPVEAARYLRERGLQGRLFNNPEIGGYLIWQLYPRHQVALDGRWEVYGDFLARIRELEQPAAFGRFAARHGVEAVVLQKSSSAFASMLPWLRGSPDWYLAADTPRAVVFERTPTGRRRGAEGVRRRRSVPRASGIPPGPP